jgi:hypothetical protein
VGGDYMGEYTDLKGRPTAKYVKNEKEFTKYLAKEYNQIMQLLEKGLEFNPDHPKTIRQIELMKQIQVMIKRMDKPMFDRIDNYIKTAYLEGRAYHMLSVGDAETMKDAIDNQSWNRVNRDKVEAIVSDTYNDILLATQNTEKHIKGLVRDTVSKVAQYNAVKNTNYTEQAEQLKKELSKKGLSERIVKEGFVGIVDKKGRRWDLGVYSKMVMKTKINDAFKEGVMQRAKEEGMDLAVISDHSADDACSKWEGVVVSMTGATKGYPTYAEARGTNQVFHPNCEHTLHPIRSLDMLHPDDIAEAKRKAKELGLKTPRHIKPKTVEPKVVEPKIEPPKATEKYPLVKRTDTQFHSSIGDAHYNKLHDDYLKDAPVEITQVWVKYEADIRGNDMSAKGNGAYYSPSKQGVYMNIEKDSNGTHYSTPYQVVFHEFAHNIDFLANVEMGGSRYVPFSYAYEDNKFGKTLQKEFDAKIADIDKRLKAEFKANSTDAYWLYANGYIDRWRVDWYKEHPEELGSIKYKKAYAYKALEKEIKAIPLKDRANLSDIIEGASKAKVQGGFGHGAKYWKNAENLPCEAFAEMMDSTISNPAQLEQIKKYFPESYEVFKEMLKVIINN